MLMKTKTYSAGRMFSFELKKLAVSRKNWAVIAVLCVTLFLFVAYNMQQEAAERRDTAAECDFLVTWYGYKSDVYMDFYGQFGGECLKRIPHISQSEPLILKNWPQRCGTTINRLRFMQKSPTTPPRRHTATGCPTMPGRAGCKRICQQFRPSFPAQSLRLCRLITKAFPITAPRRNFIRIWRKLVLHRSCLLHEMTGFPFPFTALSRRFFRLWC